MQTMKILRGPTFWGASALVLIVVVALAAAQLYLKPPGQKVVTFYSDDVASIRPGDEVRIAGIKVGKIEDISLEPNLVRVRARVDNEAFVGDQSQVEVRMLTVVGGYYTNIVSLGDKPLGNQAIPAERVKMPYSLIRTLTDATDVANKIDTKPINESLNQLQAGLAGPNLDSLGSVINAGNALIATVDAQRGQITKILNLSDEYIENFNGFGQQLRQLVEKMAVIQQTLTMFSKGFEASMTGMGELMASVQPVADFYMSHRDEFLEKVRDWQQKGRLFVERNGIIIRGLHRIQRKLNRILDAENAGPELLATDLCMPLPGSPC